MIRNGKVGDIVYLKQGYGPKCKIMAVVQHTGHKKLYLARILDGRGHPSLVAGDKVARRAGMFSRQPATEIELIE